MGLRLPKFIIKRRGLSIGGYGEAFYTNYEGDKTDVSDFLRAILYFGYKFNDQWILNTEFEFEHASTGEEGSVSVEFAYLDYLHSEALNFRAGLLLVPVGLVNELHEPGTFLGALRPTVENRIIPTTWRENGIGLFGDIGILSYKAYLINGLDGSGFSEKGLRGGRQKGSKAKSEDFAGVVRVDLAAMEGVTIGGSVYYGDSGQDLDVAATTQLVEGHLDVKKAGWSFRALAVQAEVDDAAGLSRILATSAAEDGVTPADSEISAVGEEMFGWYVETGYDLLNLFDTGEKSITPFVRVEQYDTQDKVPAGFARSSSTDEEVITLGVNFKPIDEIVFKAEWQSFDKADDQFNLSMGYNF